ncbi:hypothetical protein [Paenibacillus aceris]|uniref:Diadenosine tetraphosphate (Ap4A) HIT family hydrolase n=1 Tax=Paenibacillus aceris TaxID=869555 RepID=A0ABS4I0G9_9BACL|nr:hypothetical protein [Paenibacillus aceris]MBP1964413.1 diadenosine tetraphosphate (Ap4A) HIT family hydrolase [Paenibacillus aceris]NHW35873.1 hypothetical protein [Paenibacillus aceris]
MEGDQCLGTAIEIYHMHIFPRYEQDGFAWQEPIDTKNAKERLSETRERIRDLIS